MIYIKRNFKALLLVLSMICVFAIPNNMVKAEVNTEDENLVSTENTELEEVTPVIEVPASITLTPNNEDGTITIKTNALDSTDSVESVKFKVWISDEKSAYYTATENEDGSFSATVDSSKFAYFSGNYYVKATANLVDGTSVVFVEKQKATLKLSNFIVYGKTNDKFIKNFYIYYPTVKENVTGVVWSEVGGGKDKKSYNATYDSDKDRLLIRAKMSLMKGPGTCYLQLNNKAGKSIKKYEYKIEASDIAKTGWHYTKLSDGKTYKIYYKNGKPVNNLTNVLKLQKSGTLYAEVNRKKCRVTIYAYDNETKSWCIPVICFKCSPGVSSTPTPTGTFKTSQKFRWHELMGPSYGQYCTRITGGVLFHSVAGGNRTTYNLSARQYNKLGNPASHGCVRLCVRDAKWIYDYCAAGMKVKIFDDSFAGPLEPQVVPKIPSGQKYDPTDPNAPKNKYNQ